MSKETLVILNPRAGGGRAERLWPRLEPLMHEHFGSLEVAITKTPQQVGEYLSQARDAGIARVISVGGDGTNHIIVNAMLELQNHTPGPPMVFGHIPLGTGQDFARALKIPSNPEAAIPWLAQRKAHPADIGRLVYDGKQRYFLNIASSGVSGEVAERVEDIRRRPWSFYMASMRSFLTFDPPRVRVTLDSKPWYEGKCWLIAVANGAVFGRGMAIAPNAKVNDGVFDVIIAKDAPRWRVLRTFNTVYSGKHLELDDIEVRRGAKVEVEALDHALPIELDGEPTSASQMQYEIQPNALQMIYSGN